MKVTEDEIYRSSTQFKHWSFTPAQLAAQRSTTNILATERVKANVARQRAQRAESDGISSGMEGNGDSGANTPDAVTSGRAEVDCLTAEEELSIVDEFCERAVKLGVHCKFGFNVIVRTIHIYISARKTDWSM